MTLLRALLIAWLCLFAQTVNATNLHALVIGNSNYQYSGALANASNDARAIAAKLRKLGFSVIESVDQNRREMRHSLRTFNQRLSQSNNPVSVMFYAGHGIQRNGQNYLIPVDADINKAYEIEDTSINLGTVLASMNEAKPSLSIIMLDACRNNPFERKITPSTRSSFYRGSGLAAVDGLYGTILSYATEPGRVAVDGHGEHSPYTTALLRYMSTPGLSIQEMLNQVGLSVMEHTRGEQKPWVSSSPVPRFCFAGCDHYPVPTTNTLVELEPAPGVLADVSAVQTAIRNQDIKALKQLAYIEAKQEQQLQQLFRHYPDILVEPTPRSRSLLVNGTSQSVDMQVVEAKNEEGNRVIPGPHWKQLSFQLR